jgi:hypothetical protein
MPVDARAIQCAAVFLFRKWTAGLGALFAPDVVRDLLRRVSSAAPDGTTNTPGKTLRGTFFCPRELNRRMGTINNASSDWLLSILILAPSTDGFLQLRTCNRTRMPSRNRFLM